MGPSFKGEGLLPIALVCFSAGSRRTNSKKASLRVRSRGLSPATVRTELRDDSLNRSHTTITTQHPEGTPTAAAPSPYTLQGAAGRCFRQEMPLPQEVRSNNAGDRPFILQESPRPDSQDSPGLLRLSRPPHQGHPKRTTIDSLHGWTRAQK